MGLAREYAHGITDPKRALERVEEADAKRRRRSAKSLSGWELNATQRRKELTAVALYRRRERLAVGPDLGWAMVIGNLVRVLHGHVTADMIKDAAAAIGRPPIDEESIAVAVQEIGGKAWGRYRLYTGAQAGSAIELTVAERYGAGVTKLESFEESGAARKRRENRERMQQKRAAGAALRRPTQKQIAALLGISLSKLKRDLRDGHLAIAELISVQRSYISPLSSKDPCTENGSHRSLHGKRLTPGGDR